MSNIIVISGPGGVGKGTVVDRIVELDEQLEISRSWTTRDRRPGESEDAYYFCSHDEFEAAIAADAFLEYDHHFGNYYGSPVPTMEETHDLILEIDVNGAQQIHHNGHKALFIFIDTPSLDIQEARMLSRGDAVEKVKERLAGGQRERELAKSLPYVHVLNDDLDACTAAVLDLITNYRRERANTDQVAGNDEAC